MLSELLLRRLRLSLSAAVYTSKEEDLLHYVHPAATLPLVAETPSSSLISLLEQQSLCS